jgi:hypothetical protein
MRGPAALAAILAIWTLGVGFGLHKLWQYSYTPGRPVFIVGVAFTMVRVRTNSVAAAFLMHCGYNFALFAALWLASDHYRHLEKVTG